MTPDDTLPPRKPNTLRVLLPRAWAAACKLVSEHPDWALALFLIALGVAVVL